MYQIWFYVWEGEYQSIETDSMGKARALWDGLSKQFVMVSVRP